MLREKSTTTAKLPIVGSHTVVAMPRINNVDYLLVASMDGYLFCYTLANDGGECPLMRQYQIGPPGAHEEEADGDVLAKRVSVRKIQQFNQIIKILRVLPKRENRETI
jgi:hypothetical protein